MIVKILGFDWEIIKKKYDEEECFDRTSCDGYCDGYQRKIVVCDMTTYKGWEHEEPETIVQCEKLTLRHEIVHAYLYSCGLQDSTLSCNAWAKNEEMTDWIAAIGPQIYLTWKEAGCL